MTIKDKLLNKKSTFIFYSPEDKGNHLASTYEIFYHAWVLKQNGFDTKVWFDNSYDNNRELPTWFEDNLLDVEIIKTEEKGKLKASVADFLILQDNSAPIIEQLKNVNINKVIWINSLDKFLTSLNPGMDYYSFYGIKDFMVTSSYMSDVLKSHYHSYPITTYETTPSIPNYFKTTESNSLNVSVFSKNSTYTRAFVNSFMQKNPYYKFIVFDNISNLDKRVMADKISKSICTIFLDDYASYPLTPMEVLACEKVCLVKKGHHDLESIIQSKNIYSSDDIFDGDTSLVRILSQLVNSHLEDYKMFIKDNTEEELINKHIQSDNTQQKIVNMYYQMIEDKIKEFNLTKEEK